jgi:hypothetical protein
MGVPFGVFLGRFVFDLAFPHAAGIAFDQGDIRVMGDAVEHRSDASRVGENGIPFLKDYGRVCAECYLSPLC